MITVEIPGTAAGIVIVHKIATEIVNGTEIGIQFMTVTVTVFGKEIGTVNGSVIEIGIGTATVIVIVIVKNVFEMAVLVATDMWMERIRINTTEIKTATEKDRGGKMTINEKIEVHCNCTLETRCRTISPTLYVCMYPSIN